MKKLPQSMKQGREVSIEIGQLLWTRPVGPALKTGDRLELVDGAHNHP